MVTPTEEYYSDHDGGKLAPIEATTVATSRSLDNVLATPHIGFVARELYRTFYRDTVENITRWLDQQA